MDRRRMMMLTGIGALAAAVAVPEARADRLPVPAAPSGGVNYLFRDEFDGPAGSAPDASKWETALAREDMEDPTYWELPGNVGQYRDDRRNVFLDGKSNLVFHAAKDGNTYYSGKLFGKYRGEVDIMEWYGNGSWAPGTTVHAKLNGGEHSSQTIAVDSAWHTWRTQWDANGLRFWKDYVDGAQPYFDVPASALPDWPFNTPGYTLFPILNLAVAGSGGGDPRGGTYPADMLVDWVRVW
jgi:hypothetical protein